ncbi:MAG: 2-oxoacid:acceptor oxidoreductase family protein [Victivallales bacterium]|nr:2-oxoacid:acceptor oxidoreductase family protein [Victivallales bacterium]
MSKVVEKVKFGKSSGFFNVFERRPGNIKKNMHYCPGCGHGILHKLIAEAMVDLGMQDRMIIIAPVGCSVFSYYYYDAAGISVPHGRAPAVGTGLLRANPDCFVISYQGDGDLGAIGLNNFLQAANRGENMTVCFVNNGIYGMTSGQMAPTTLVGQQTATSPYGRSVTNEGYPLKVAEMVAALESPIYVERVALTSAKNIRTARKALRKGLFNMKQRKGFSLIEFLSGCPVNLKKNAKETNDWIEQEMASYFPLGCLKDIEDSRPPISRPKPIFDKDEVMDTLIQSAGNIRWGKKKTVLRKDLRIKCAGFGGQGILSLGMMIAAMGQSRGINVSWLPSYGPEMRGGTANCSVVLSNDIIGSPIVKETNILIAMNQQSMDKFLPDLIPGGILLYDRTGIGQPKTKSRIFSVEASRIAVDIGDIRCANSAIMGAFAACLKGFEMEDYEEAFEEAIRKTFRKKQQLIDYNIRAFSKGKESVKIENV